MSHIPPISAIRSRLRTRHLQLVLALSERASLRRAAEDLAMTQPAASKALQELEDLLGMPLFIRHSRGMKPTVCGEAIIRYARVVFADLNKLREEMVAIQAGDVGKVRIGSIRAPISCLLNHAIIALKKQHPKLHIMIEIATSNVLALALERDQLDLYIGRIPDGWQAQHLSFDHISGETLSIIARPGHPVVKRKIKPTLSMLAQYPWIVQPHPSPMRQIIDQTFREMRVTPPVSRVEASSTLMTMALLQESDMIAVVSTPLAHYYQRQKMSVTIPIALRGQLDPYGLVLPHNRIVTPATQLVIEAILKEAKSV